MLKATATQQQGGRLVELDALRGIACISVILFHYTYYYDINWQHSQTPLILFEYGRYGVELFFIISGFVIFLSLKNKPVRDFMLLRFWRLFPAYWIAISFIFLISQRISLSPEVLAHGNLSWVELMANFTMVPTIFSLRYVDSSHWTLGFELLFYCLAAVICLRSKFKEGAILPGLMLLTSVSVFWHSLIKHFFDIQIWMTVWWHEDMLHWQYAVAKLLVLPYVHLFMIGVAFYLLYKKKALGLPILGIVFGVVADYFLWGWEHFIVVLLVILIFCTAVFLRLPALRHKGLVYLGTISYSLYLVHQNIGFRIIQAVEGLGVNSNVAILVAVVSVVVLAHPLYFFVEKPLYQFAKRRLAARKASSSQV